MGWRQKEITEIGLEQQIKEPRDGLITGDAFDEHMPEMAAQVADERRHAGRRWRLGIFDAESDGIVSTNCFVDSRRHVKFAVEEKFRCG